MPIELRRERVDLGPSLTRAAELLQPEIDERRQTLSLSLPDGPCPVVGDATRLEQAFSNLLQNASKFTGRSGHVWLSAHLAAAADGPGDVVVRIRDDGIGIPAEMLPHVFELFKQAGASPHHATGLGVGLALVHRIITLHGGKVTVESGGPNRGTEFIVSLPRDHAEHRESEIEIDRSTAGLGGVSRRILVVDDNVDAAESLAELLLLRGHEVRVAYSGAAALEEVGAFLPGLIFLDIAMPEMDGYEVARRVRRRADLGQPFIVAVTGFGRDADRQMARDAGFDQHATKPLDPDVLARLLNASPTERK